jgi:tRNA (cmo5U34)-methyltransferase
MDANVSSVGHYPANDKWGFDESVTNCFSDMLRRSIPSYDTMRRTVTSISIPFIRSDGYVLDLGCSRGDAIAEMMPFASPSTRWIGVEVSEPMREASRLRFLNHPFISIVDHDLRGGLENIQKNYLPSPDAADLILSVLTIQFVPIEYRPTLIKSIYNALRPEGAFILVEKVLGMNGLSDELLRSQYHALKGENGYSQEDIDRKRLSLEGVLVPITAKWNEEMLKDSGFATVECFWRVLNFGGWIAIKA